MNEPKTLEQAIKYSIDRWNRRRDEQQMWSNLIKWAHNNNGSVIVHGDTAWIKALGHDYYIGFGGVGINEVPEDLIRAYLKDVDNASRNEQGL